jgi:GMP synthase (glutamine-hydrolysing)
MRVLAFRHEDGGDLGTIRGALESRGILIDCVDLYAGSEPPDASRAAGLIVMGGAVCANDDLPFLRRELEIIRAAIRRGQPVFGVCLGSQLIARALGAKVFASPVAETGWKHVHVEPGASTDPVFHSLEPSPRVFQFHQDTFELPAGSVRLASSGECANQAFRWGRAVYGVQFHPEMTEGMVREWSRESNLPEWPETPVACSDLARTCDKLLGGWGALL